MMKRGRKILSTQKRRQKCCQWTPWLNVATNKKMTKSQTDEPEDAEKVDETTASHPYNTRRAKKDLSWHFGSKYLYF